MAERPNLSRSAIVCVSHACPSSSTIILAISTITIIVVIIILFFLCEAAYDGDV